MASASEIKTRISSVRDTMKITRAMYMISSTKLTKARKTLENTEPFFYDIQNQMKRLLRHAPDLQHQAFDDHERHQRDHKTIGYVVITADKGMAGAYNHNVEKMTEELMAKSEYESRLYVIGEVGRQYFDVRDVHIAHHFRYTAQNPSLGRARSMAEYLFEQFDDEKVDEIYIIYTRMINRLNAETTVEKLVPLTKTDFTPSVDAQLLAGLPQEEFELYPSAEGAMDNAVRVYLTGFIYGALVESFSSEQNARMQAMQSATDSAEEMLHDLQIQYNRVRQAAITQEITEVAGGAKALRRKKQQTIDKKRMVNTNE